MDKKKLHTCMLVLLFLGFCIFLGVTTIGCMRLASLTIKSPNDLQVFLIYSLVGTISFIAGLIIKMKYQLPFNWKK